MDSPEKTYMHQQNQSQTPYLDKVQYNQFNTKFGTASRSSSRRTLGQASLSSNNLRNFLQSNPLSGGATHVNSTGHMNKMVPKSKLSLNRKLCLSRK